MTSSYPEDGVSRFIGNTGNHLPDYTMRLLVIYEDRFRYVGYFVYNLNVI